jgi:hypothetical protein
MASSPVLDHFMLSAVFQNLHFKGRTEGRFTSAQTAQVKPSRRIKAKESVKLFLGTGFLDISFSLPAVENIVSKFLLIDAGIRLVLIKIPHFFCARRHSVPGHTGMDSIH